MKITRNKIIWFIVIIAVLLGAFFYGGNYVKNEEQAVPTGEEVLTSSKTEEPVIKEEAVNEEKTAYEEEKTPEPVIEEEKETNEEKKENTCTLTIRCDTILSNINLLKENKKGIVPENGVILDKITVAFNEGESVFNILRRETKKNKIHLEFSSTPIYNSIYIEGIANLYEFDCGELSGWTYKVNGKSPGYSSSECVINPGDEIEWLYTCDLGKDVNATVQLSQ